MHSFLYRGNAETTDIPNGPVDYIQSLNFDSLLENATDPEETRKMLEVFISALGKLKSVK